MVETREMRPEDATAVAHLLGDTFNEPRDQAEVRYAWKYAEGVCGPVLVHIAVSDGQLAGTVAARRRRVSLAGAVLEVADLMDLATHPSYRRQGIFKRLVQEVCDTLATRGVVLIYCRPNENSFPGLIRSCGFTEVGTLRQLVRPLRPGTHVAARFPAVLAPTAAVVGNALGRLVWPRLRAPKGIDVTRVDRFMTDVDGIGKAMCNDYELIGVRDHKYLNWRFQTNPRPFRLFEARTAGRIRGFAVTLITRLARGTLHGYVVEIGAPCDDGPTRQALLAAVLRDMQAQEALSAMFWMIEDGLDPLPTELRRTRFMERGSRLHLVARALAPDGEPLARPRPCFLQIGDLGHW